MSWEKIKANGVFQFAVGVLVLLVVLNWMLSGSLLLAVNSWINPPPADDATQFVAPAPWLEALMAIVYSAVGAVGVYAIATAEFVFRGIRLLVLKQPEQAEASRSVIADAPAEPASPDTRQLVIDLGRAAFENDLARLESIRWQIRMPQAIAELAEAYRKGDLGVVAELQLELEAGLVKPSKKGAQNG